MARKHSIKECWANKLPYSLILCKQNNKVHRFFCPCHFKLYISQIQIGSAQTLTISLLAANGFLARLPQSRMNVIRCNLQIVFAYKIDRWKQHWVKLFTFFSRQLLAVCYTFLQKSFHNQKSCGLRHACNHFRQQGLKGLGLFSSAAASKVSNIGLAESLNLIDNLSQERVAVVGTIIYQAIKCTHII